MHARALFPAIIAILALCGCSSGDSSPVLGNVVTPKAALEQSAFHDCADYRAYYARALSREYLEGFWFGVPCWGCETAQPATGAPSTASGAYQDSAMGPASASAPAPVAVSQTNTQESGVDEEDVIDADPDTGRFYLLRGYAANELLTVDAVPAEQMAVTSRQDTGDHYASGLYLDPVADRLVVVASQYNWIMWDGPRANFASGSTQLLFYDVSTPDTPKLVDRYEISGYLLGSRRIGQRLHLVTSSTAGLPSALAQDSSFFDLVYRDYYNARQAGNKEEVTRLANEIRSRIATAVSDAPLEELLPVWRQGLDSVTAPAPLSCADVTHPQLDERLGLVTISSINTDGTALAQMATVNNAWQIYSSPQNLYLAQTSSGWWWDPNQTQQTSIYRYRLDATGPASPAGHGMVDGWLNTSYALSEYNDHLRAATTEARYSADRGWQRSNHLFVLGSGNAMPIVGAVRDFMRDESIFSSRFIGDRGYVVTFRIVDPLITFDLSDPSKPRVAGTLEVPGVSTYLHPYDADHLVAIGRSVSTAGTWTSHVQLSLFDVADLAAPKLLASTDLGGDNEWAWSVAQYEPHAFTLFNDVLSIPVQISASDWTQAFSGFAAFRVAVPTGFSELGRIDHKQPDNGSGSGCPTVTDGSAAPCASFAPVIFNQPLRSVVVTEDSGRTVLYTLSGAFLRAHTVGDALTDIKTLSLEPPP